MNRNEQIPWSEWERLRDERDSARAELATARRLMDNVLAMFVLQYGRAKDGEMLLAVPEKMLYLAQCCGKVSAERDGNQFLLRVRAAQK